MISPNGTHGAVIVLTNIKIFSIPRIRKGKYFASFTDLPPNPHNRHAPHRPFPRFSPFRSYCMLPATPLPHPLRNRLHPRTSTAPLSSIAYPQAATIPPPFSAAQPGSLSIHPIQPRRATSGHPLPRPGRARVHRSATRSGSVHPPRAQKKGRPVIGRPYNSGG